MCWLLCPSGVVLRRPHALTAKICFDMVPGFGSYLQVVVGVLALLAFIQFQTRFIMWSWKLFRVSFPIPNAVSVSCFFFPFDKRARKVLNPCAFCFLILNLSPFLFLIQFVFFDFLSQKRCICSHTSVFATQHLGKEVVEIKAQELGRNKSQRSGIGKTSGGDCHKVGACPIKVVTTSTSGV